MECENYQIVNIMFSATIHLYRNKFLTSDQRLEVKKLSFNFKHLINFQVTH